MYIFRESDKPPLTYMDYINYRLSATLQNLSICLMHHVAVVVIVHLYLLLTVHEGGSPLPAAAVLVVIQVALHCVQTCCAGGHVLGLGVLLVAVALGAVVG